MNLNAIIDRIKTDVPELRLVGGSVEVAIAQENTRTTPAAFIIPATETSGPNTLGANAVSQEVTATFTVVTAVANYRDATGLAGHDALQDIRTKMLKSLIGWVPPGAAVEITHNQGNMAYYNDSTLWWQDVYSTKFYRRKV